MRFDSLDIPAFGPFHDFSLKFPASKYDLHLVYGPNEAGKSSLLRAIRQLVFGIPARTRDNFRHPNQRLLIGATVSQGDKSLTFQRKKGNKNTLLDEAQNALPEEALAPFLGSVNEEFFCHMFWLDTDSLREGARKLLAGEGDLGTALFSASLGGSPVDEAIKRLEAEANSLCKGTSKKNTTILPALADYKESEKEARRTMISAHAWRTLKSEISRSEEALAEVENRLREHQRRGHFVESCLRALPILRAIRDLESDLGEIDLPDLPSDFPEQVREGQKALARSEEAYQLHKNRLESAERQLKEIPEVSPILAATGDFQMVARRAEQHLANLEILPRLKSELTETNLDQLPVVPADVLARVRDLASRLQELTSRDEETRRALSQLEIEIASQRRGLTGARDLSRLEDECRRVEEFAIEHATLPALQAKREDLAKKTQLLAKRLGLTGDPRLVSVPGRKTIQQAGRDGERLAEAVREREEKLRENRDAIATEEASLRHLAAQAPLYSRADLLSARKERDDLWAAIRKSGQPDEDLGAAMAKADEIADTLREEADQLAQATGHQARLTQLQAAKDHLEPDLQQARQEYQEWCDSWQPQSRGFSPVALLEWREEWEGLCLWVIELEETENRIEHLQSREQSLLTEMGGEDFERLHRSLKASLKEANQEQGERRSLKKLLNRNEVKREQLKLERDALKEEFAERQNRWEKLREEVGWPEERPITSVVETLQEQIRARERLLEYQKRLEEVKNYEEKVRDLGRRFQVEASEPVLSALHEQARLDHDRARVLRNELTEWRETFPEVRLSYENDRKRLEELARQAGLDEEAELSMLDRVIPQVERRTDLQTRLSERLEALRSLAGNRSCEEFEKELEAQDADELASEKLVLEQRGEEIQQERDEMRAELNEHLRNQREMMQASDASAAHRQAAAEALATIVSDTGRFRQLHYAIAFLKKQVEEYRRKTQGPMLEGTSAFFQTLTQGTFAGVSAQWDDRDQPQLVALRPDGEAVPTTGLSEGTADQLYLSLRLAAIDLHLQNHAAIPLILDDLLMTFDDARTKALLPVLTRLSEKTQILIFTHHEHLTGLVDGKVSLHRIPGP